MSFPDADEFNAIHGTRFIADLMPRTPIYVALLAESAQAVIGQPHPTGRPALSMLEEEGFYYDRYIDIFDGGPTVIADTDDIRSVRESTYETVSEIGDGGRARMLVAAGRLNDFRACIASVKRLPRKGLCIDREAARVARGGSRRPGSGRRALMPLVEINFDGIIGPSHNYAGLSLGNLASTRNAGQVSQPRAAALQGLDKMRANLALGLSQGYFRPPRRGPTGAWLAELGTDYEHADPALAANAMSASAMWAANAATVSPAPDTADGRCHLTVANLQIMPHRSHEWPATLAQLRLAFADCQPFRRAWPGPARVRRRGRGQPHAADRCARRAGRRGLRLRRRRRRVPRAPAFRGVESDRPASPARSRADDLRQTVRGSDRRRRVPQ